MQAITASEIKVGDIILKESWRSRNAGKVVINIASTKTFVFLTFADKQTSKMRADKIIAVDRVEIIESYASAVQKWHEIVEQNAILHERDFSGKYVDILWIHEAFLHVPQNIVDTIFFDEDTTKAFSEFARSIEKRIMEIRAQAPAPLTACSDCGNVRSQSECTKDEYCEKHFQESFKQAAPSASNARFDRFDICEAYLAIEMDYNEGGMVKGKSYSSQLHRMQFRAGAAFKGFDSLTENGKKIYMAKAQSLGFIKAEDTMDREQIMNEYDVESGVIKSPGKFEGEALYVPFFYNAYLDGMADEYDNDVVIFNISDDDCVKFPELRGVKTLRLSESDSGFVYAETE